MRVVAVDSDMAGEEGSARHFAVYLPSLSEDPGQVAAAGAGEEEEELSSEVFGTLPEALALVRRFRKLRKGNARFKAFHSEDHARQFAEGHLPEDGEPPSTPRKGSGVREAPEESSPFKHPTRPQFTQLKKAIEASDLHRFDLLVEENPRLLINASGDVPSIVFEGCRYNALHLAAKAGSLEVGRRVVELVSDPAFVGRIFPASATPASAAAQAAKLLDYFLNTPDKSLQETPLHFAAKLGHVQLLQLLAAQPSANIDARNKYGETALDLAAAKAKLSGRALDVTRREIQTALCRQRLWVPLYRSWDWGACATVAQPTPREPDLTRTQGDTLEFLAAVAGPLDAGEAESLRREWSTAQGAPTDGPAAASGLRDVCHLRRSDANKGAERIGRRLARAHSAPWSEYWTFLEDYADLSSQEGLDALEAHLRRRQGSDDWDAVPGFLGPATLSESALQQLGAVKGRIPPNHPSPFRSAKKSRLDAGSESSPALFSPSQAPSKSETPIRTKLSFELAPEEEKENLLSPTPDKAWAGDRSERSLLAEQLAALKLRSPGDGSGDGDNGEAEGGAGEGSESESEEFETPPSTPPGGYLTGPRPTGTDLEVLQALRDGRGALPLLLSASQPLLARWLRHVSFFSDQDRAQWPHLFSPRHRQARGLASPAPPPSPLLRHAS